MRFGTVHARQVVALLFAMSAPLASRPIWAQQAQDSEAEPELVDIIVTAQKRAENIQDVPISVVSVTSQALQDANVKDINQLQVLTPGLTVSSDQNENTTVARIRGIGTVGDNPGLESSVGLVIDGVYRPRNGVGFGNLGELEQVQVLEGPQGELFGKNNDAGVIVVTTKKPTDTFSADAQVTYGNYNEREVSASVNGGLNSLVAGRLYAEFERRDGWLDENTGLGPNNDDRTNSRNGFLLRGQLLFTLTDNADFLFIADFAKRNESCCGAVPRVTGPFQGLLNVIAGTPAAGGVAGATATSLTPSTSGWANEPFQQATRDMGVSGELHWDLGFGKLTSITAWRDNTIQAGEDPDYTGIDLLQFPYNDDNRIDFKQFSEELRLAGKAGPVDWLVGAFYANEILTPNVSFLAGDNLNTFLSGLASSLSPGGTNFSAIGNAFTPGVSGYIDRYRQTDDSFALFSNETWQIVDKLDLTGGLRYTNEDKKSRSSFSEGDGGAGCLSLPPQASKFSAFGDQALFLVGCSVIFNPLFNNIVDNQSLHENNVSGTVKLAYHFTDDLMAYASWGNGYKAGGFNFTPVTPPQSTAPIPTPVLNTSFPDETVDSYELGLKTTWFSKTLRLNGAIFDQRYKDFQLDTFTGIEFIVTSVRSVVSKGADLDMEWATPLRGLTLSTGATYAFTNIEEFGDAAPYVNADRLNNRLSFAPLWSGAASATYQVPLSRELVARAVVDEKYTSSYNTGSDLDPNKLQGGYGLMDARIGIGSSDNRWSVEAWSQNLLNKFYYQVAFDAVFQLNQIDAFPGAPRFFGVTGRLHF